MSAQTLNTLAQVFGTLGTVLWCIQLAPQIWLNFRRKTTKGLSVYLYFGWLASSVCYAPYAVFTSQNIPIIVQPQCYGSLCAIVAIQALYYDKNWSPWQGVALFGAYCALGGGWEFGIYRAMVRADQVGVKGIPMLFGILSDIFLTAAFFPQIWQIWQEKEVVGISYLFLMLDSAGAVCSIISLGLKKSIDGVAIAGYIGVIIVEVIVLLAALYYNPNAERKRHAAEKEGDIRNDPDVGSDEDIVPVSIEEGGQKVNESCTSQLGL